MISFNPKDLSSYARQAPFGRLDKDPSKQSNPKVTKVISESPADDLKLAITGSKETPSNSRRISGVLLFLS